MPGADPGTGAVPGTHASSGPTGIGRDEATAREALRAVAALVGIPVTVTSDEAWRLDAQGLRAGLGWYTRRGHGPTEAAALALLQLWEGVRVPRLAPERAARSRLLATARPELTQLVAAIGRAQAAADVIAAFPGMRSALVAALHRGLPHDLGPQSPGDQWLALTLATGFGVLSEHGFVGVTEAVQREWDSATGLGDAAGQAVWWVLRPDPDRSALERFERAIALLAPGYERLIAATASGLGADAAAAPPHEGGAASEDSGAAADDADAGGEGDPEATDAEDPGAAATEPPAHARPGGGAEVAEGADLFQAEQAGEVTAFLDTPLPAEGALTAAFAPTDAEAGAGDPSDVRAGAGGSLAARAGDYVARVSSLASSIEHMRDVWHEVTTERVARVRLLGRRPQTEGETLDTGALADGLAQVRAGVRRPRVFHQRELRTRRARQAGNTDYVLLIDRSASMQGRPARAAADAAVVMLEGLAAAARDIAAAEASSGLDLELQLRTALIVFDARAHVVKPLSTGMSDDVRADLLAAITTPQGSTNDAAALAAASEQFRGSGEALQRRRIAFVLSDGGTNDAVAAEHALRRLRAMGVTVFGIGLGSDDLSERYAPHGSRVDEPERLAEVIGSLIARHLP